MATSLRLRSDAESAVRAEAARSGRSQQDVIRDAIDQHLGLRTVDGRVRAPRSPYRRPARRVRLPDGSTTIGLLERAER